MSDQFALYTVVPDAGSSPDPIPAWQEVLLPSIDTLRTIAGTTEDEFLQIGSQLQEFYIRSSEISELASRLVEVVSGGQVQSLIARLRHMMADMERYLAGARQQSDANCRILEQIFALLNQVSQPLEGFQKMNKVLRMLSTSTKIESARIGEKGLGFVTLAMDVEKLSHMVNDKSANILSQRQILTSIITEDLHLVQTTESAQDAEVGAGLKSTSMGLEKLESVNNCCTDIGNQVSAISAEVLDNIGEVVASMQAHDMTRQQIEHVVEALERLLENFTLRGDDARKRGQIVEAGDVCELQVAQLRHAIGELNSAVVSIIENLREVARRQSLMAEQTMTISGIADPSGHSFIESLSSGMSTVTAALSRCAEADQDMSVTMKKVARTIGEITGFVTDIEDIGSEIDLIALNSQIKAAHTGSEGAALGVLAEAIKRLSVDTVVQTDALSHTLIQINEVTENLFKEVEQESESAGSQLSVMEQELEEIITTLANMNTDLHTLLTTLGTKVTTLMADIDRATGAVDVHIKISSLAERVVDELQHIVEQSRELEPASAEFKDNLRHMEERYSMQSERRIHEAIARKRGGGTAVIASSQAPRQEDVSKVESEFGDNVDLF